MAGNLRRHRALPRMKQLCRPAQQTQIARPIHLRRDFRPLTAAFPAILDRSQPERFVHQILIHTRAIGWLVRDVSQHTPSPTVIDTRLDRRMRLLWRLVPRLRSGEWQVVDSDSTVRHAHGRPGFEVGLCGRDDLLKNVCDRVTLQAFDSYADYRRVPGVCCGKN